MDPALKKAIQCPLLDDNLELWIRCCTSRFLPLARRIAGDDALARDALQESWTIVLQKLYQYRGGPPACGWVRSIVRHEALHVIGPRLRETSLDRADETVGGELPDAAAYAAELRRLVLAAIDELPPTYRQVVQLRDIEERPSDEVARELHISKQNVAVRLHRAHRLLQARLQRQR